MLFDQKSPALLIPVANRGNTQTDGQTNNIKMESVQGQIQKSYDFETNRRTCLDS